jgi:DNA replication and repair protein RecF
LSQLAGQIVQARSRLVDEINKTLPGIYMSLSKDKVKVLSIYKTQFHPDSYETSYLKQLEDDLEDDLRAGFTMHGPHRDDFTVLYNNHPSANYASRGELRTAVIALKITELKKLENISNTKPVILLDDVYSELDGIRRKSLTGYLKDNQSFITTTDAGVVLKSLGIKSKVIKL